LAPLLEVLRNNVTEDPDNGEDSHDDTLGLVESEVDSAAPPAHDGIQRFSQQKVVSAALQCLVIGMPFVTKADIQVGETGNGHEDEKKTRVGPLRKHERDIEPA